VLPQFHIFHFPITIGRMTNFFPSLEYVYGFIYTPKASVGPEGLPEISRVA
jgi:hypothetical protein